MSGCQCLAVEHARRGVSVCYRKPGKARSDYIGAVCDYCAYRHMTEYLTVDTEGRITDYGRRVLLTEGGFRPTAALVGVLDATNVAAYLAANPAPEGWADRG